jgi:hypothetical protein
MRELGPKETKTYESFSSFILTLPFASIALMQLAFPFVAPLLPITQQNEPGLWPAYVTGPILAAPFIAGALWFTLRGKFRRITLDRYSISWKSGLKEGRLEWSEILAMRESTSHVLSFEFETRGGLVKVPFAGVAGREELRALVRLRVSNLPREGRAPLYQPWKVWAALALSILVALSIGVLSGWVKETLSPPFTRLQLTTLSSLAHIFPWILLAPYQSYLQPFISSIDLSGENLVYREFPFRKTSIPYGRIIKLEIKETALGFLDELVVHYNNAHLTLPKGHLDLLAVADQLSQKSGRTIQYTASDAMEAAAR